MQSQSKTFKLILKTLLQDLDRALLANPLVILVLIGHFVFSALFIQKGLIDHLSAWDTVLYFVKGFLFSFVFYLFCDRLLALLSTNLLRLTFQLSFVSLFFLLQVFHLLSGAALDFPLVAYNFTEIFNKEAFISIFVSVSPVVYAILAFGFISFTWYLKKHFQPPTYNSSPWYAVPLGILFFWNFTYVSISSCPFTFFLQTTANSFYFNNQPGLEKQYPYWEPIKISQNFTSRNEKPNVFILIVESFSSEFFQTKSPEGQEYTPFLNQLAKSSAVVDSFYSTSIQTARSQFAMFCGIPAGFRKKEFTDHLSLNLNCLPSIVKQHGYETYFFKAYEDIDFDNTRYFANKLGFDVQKGMDKSFISDKDKPFIWGWGLQDDKFYEKFFSYLDQHKNSAAPVFASLTTVTNHMMFDHVPIEIRPLYKEPRDVKENYANTIRLSDQYISVFFAELKKRPEFSNSIIIITGDNGYPVGQHQLFHNESGYYDEFFKTPFIVHSLKEDLSAINLTKFASHVDLAPTLLDLLNINTQSHFVGRTVFKSDDARTILMSQPYAGGYLIVRQKNFKFVKNLTYGTEYLYDTELDTEERANLISDSRFAQKAEELRNKVNDHFINQSLIEQNRLAPPALKGTNSSNN